MAKSSHTITTPDGVEISYDHTCQGHPCVIVLAHGFFNSKQAVLFREMAEGLSASYDVVVLDFRGHGESGGWFDWTAKEKMDLQAVLRAVKPEYQKLGLVGFSLGAAISILTASTDEQEGLIDSLITVSAPCDFDRIDKHFWKMGFEENIFYNVFKEGRIGKGVRPGKLWLKKIRPVDVVGEIICPVLFVHGTKDWLILPWHSELLYERATSEKALELIEGGTHAEFLFRRDPGGILNMFTTWFARTLC